MHACLKKKALRKASTRKFDHVNLELQGFFSALWLGWQRDRAIYPYTEKELVVVKQLDDHWTLF